MIHALPLCKEDLFVTMQIAIRVHDSSIVLASDTLSRTQHRQYDSSVIDHGVLGVATRSKIVFCENHDIAVAYAGFADEGADPALELAAHLSKEDKIDDNLGPVLTAWGDGYFARSNGTSARERDHPVCTLLVVNPHTEYCCFWQLRINKKSNDEASSTYLLNGLGANEAIFWPLYFKANEHRALDLAGATGVAAVTILTAHRLDPARIGGLEICQYVNGRWDKPWSPTRIRDIEDRFADFNHQLQDSVFGLTALNISEPVPKMS